MDALLLAVITASNILCFVIGAKVGQAVSKGKDVELPAVNPVKAYKEHQSRKKAERKQGRYETILQNIDNYDGTAYGQKEVPRE